MKNKTLSLLITGLFIPVISMCSALAQTEQEFVQEISLFPDWDEISLSDLDPIKEGGEIPQQINSKNIDDLAGWEVSRSWQKGDRIENVLKLGDLEESLSPQLFSLEDIHRRLNKASISQIENSDSIRSSIPPELTLEDFPLAGNQTIGTLVKNNPDIANSTAKEIKPIADLLKRNGYENINTDLESMTKDKDIASLSLGSLDLQKYSLDSVPNLSNAQIQDFEGYENTSVSSIPGLSELALSEFPNPIRADIGFMGRIDIIWGDAEVNRTETISGSKIEGFKVPCRSNCAYLELDDIENFGRDIASNFEGKQWIRGRDHWVNGGTGCLSGGKEPTGIHPFGDTFKSVLWDTNESKGEAEIVMFFNIKSTCGDSAYFIGPLPFPMGIVRENDWIYLGI